MAKPRFTTESHTTRTVLDDLNAGEPAISLKAVLRDPRLCIDGKTRNIAWAYRASQTGVRGAGGALVRLEVAYVGGIRITSTSAVSRFLARLNSVSVEPMPESANRPSRAASRPRSAVDAELAAAGL